ncbi:MAG: cytochrome c biogenesis protein CcdA [Trueperaceae bacterium]
MSTIARVARSRIAAVIGLSVVATGLAVLAAALTQGPVGALNEGVEALSSSSSGALGRLASWLPLGFAFGAGMVSAVNPCGFAMLPAYLGLYLRGDDDRAGTVSARLGRALLVGATVTVGFVLLFGVVGFVLGASTRSLTGAFPWIGLGTGLLLILVGAWSWFGGAIYARAGERMAQSVGGLGGRGLRGYFAFGLAYGLASLSCTLPIFLAVLGSSLTLASLPEVGLQLVLYGLGMGFVITVLTVALALFRQTVLNNAKSVVRYVGPVASAAMLIAGVYIVYYWLTIGGLRLVG